MNYLNDLKIKVDEVENPKALIVINHGFAEHIGRYDWVAEQLNNSAYTCVRYDLRGHGETKSSKGHIDSYEEFISDCEAVVDFTQALDPSKDVYILGHSMGGLVSAMAALSFQNKIKGQILSGPAIGNLPSIKGIKKPFLNFASKVLPNLMITNPVEDDVCSVKEVVEKYKIDPLVLRKASMKFLREFTIAAPDFVSEHIHEYKLPLLLLQGSKDTIVPVSIGDKFFNEISSSDKTQKVYEGLYHEILNEYEKDEVMNDIIEWLDKRIDL